MDPKERRPFMEHASGTFVRLRRRPVKSALCLLAAGAAVVAIVYVARGWGGKIAGLTELKQQTKDNPSSYEKFRSLGHAQFAAGKRAAALRSYERALSLDEGAVDETMLGNLAIAYAMNERVAADHLIARHHLLGMVPRLGQLASSHSHDVRWAAVGTLEKLGHASKTDYMHAYVADLDAGGCEVRQHAVDKLGDIGDHRALAALAAAKKHEQDTTPWYRSNCMGSRIDDAEKKIAARSPKTHPALAKK